VNGDALSLFIVGSGRLFPSLCFPYNFFGQRMESRFFWPRLSPFSAELVHFFFFAAALLPSCPDQSRTLSPIRLRVLFLWSAGGGHPFSLLEALIAFSPQSRRDGLLFLFRLLETLLLFRRVFFSERRQATIALEAIAAFPQACPPLSRIRKKSNLFPPSYVSPPSSSVTDLFRFVEVRHFPCGNASLIAFPLLFKARHPLLTPEGLF